MGDTDARAWPPVVRHPQHDGEEQRQHVDEGDGHEGGREAQGSDDDAACGRATDAHGLLAAAAQGDGVGHQMGRDDGWDHGVARRLVKGHGDTPEQGERVQVPHLDET